MPTAYCFKCRQKREIKDPKQVTLKNGRSALQGTCPVCGTKLFRIRACHRITKLVKTFGSWIIKGLESVGRSYEAGHLPRLWG